MTLTAATAIEPPGVAAQDVLPGADPQQAAAYEFTPADQRLLEAVQRGCFNYLWKEVGASSGLVKDRRLADVCSVGGVGFQLTSLPIGVERRWITRDQGQQRALSALRALAGRSDNRKHGVLLHFVDLETGGMLPEGRSEVFSTVDHALFLAGAIAAAKYFDGEVASIVDELIEQTHWKAYDVAEDGFVSMGWDPRLPRSEAAEAAPPPAGADRGGFVQPRWHIASDEERLVYFLAAGAPRSEYAVEPTDYYRLQRTVKRHENMPPLVVSWNGSAFTYFFAHCWIDYRRLAPDDPQQFGVDNPRVDWFENSRRAMLTQRERCIEAADRFKTFSDNRWGVAPCTGLDEFGRSAYLVQSVRPNLMDRDQWMGGTIAPYAAGSAIMFTPHESLAALREYRALTGGAGEPLLWSDPQAGGYGLADSFNLDQGHVSDDQIAIDAGPMLLAIENVRSGLPWRLFMEHAVAKRAVERLKLQRREP
ncbi:MAG: hypothetical protein IT424_06745 [Pirellulales bacterium]|nr:hypothetical protein [Pirellulales bacterium]